MSDTVRSLRQRTTRALLACLALTTAPALAQAAALMSHTQVTSRVIGTARPAHVNQPVAEAVAKNIAAVGLPGWTDADQPLAKAL